MNRETHLPYLGGGNNAEGLSDDITPNASVQVPVAASDNTLNEIMQAGVQESVLNYQVYVVPCAGLLGRLAGGQGVNVFETTGIGLILSNAEINRYTSINLADGRQIFSAEETQDIAFWFNESGVHSGDNPYQTFGERALLISSGSTRNEIESELKKELGCFVRDDEIDALMGQLHQSNGVISSDAVVNIAPLWETMSERYVDALMLDQRVIDALDDVVAARLNFEEAVTNGAEEAIYINPAFTLPDDAEREFDLANIAYERVTKNVENEFSDQGCLPAPPSELSREFWTTVYKEIAINISLEVATVGLAPLAIRLSKAIAPNLKITRFFKNCGQAGVQGANDCLANLRIFSYKTLAELERKLGPDALARINADLVDNIPLETALKNNPETIDIWKYWDDLNEPIIRRDFEKIRNIPNGQRPPVQNYFSQRYIDNHISSFDDGIVRFTTESSIESYGTTGGPGAFVFPKGQFDELMRSTGGDLKKVEDALGLNRGTISGNGDAVAIYIKREDLGEIKMADGNEAGANDMWLPGGLTPGKIFEAVVDLNNRDIPFTRLSL